MLFITPFCLSFLFSFVSSNQLNLPAFADKSALLRGSSLGADLTARSTPGGVTSSSAGVVLPSSLARAQLAASTSASAASAPYVKVTRSTATVHGRLQVGGISLFVLGLRLL